MHGPHLHRAKLPPEMRTPPLIRTLYTVHVHAHIASLASQPLYSPFTKKERLHVEFARWTMCLKLLVHVRTPPLIRTSGEQSLECNNFTNNSTWFAGTCIKYMVYHNIAILLHLTGFLRSYSKVSHSYSKSHMTWSLLSMLSRAAPKFFSKPQPIFIAHFPTTCKPCGSTLKTGLTGFSDLFGQPKGVCVHVQ